MADSTKNRKIFLNLWLVFSALIFIFLAFSINAYYCLPYDHKGCYGGNVYWYDSCGNRQGLVQSCGQSYWTNNFRCTGNKLEREKINISCQDAVCFQRPDWNLYQNCSSKGLSCVNNQCYSYTSAFNPSFPYPIISLSCYASPGTVYPGQGVNFIASVAGGNGTNAYSWSGACTGYLSNCVNSFSSPGVYTATVTVTSGGQLQTAFCSATVSTQKPCECLTGSCCDGCHYKPYTSSCNSQTETEYSCYWGTSCGADVGKRTRTKLQYCTGSSSQCDGVWSGWLNWTGWAVYDNCSQSQTCSLETNKCETNSSCPSTLSVPASYNKYFKTACYDNDLYWYDSSGAKQEKYQECSDNNNCTEDVCQNNKCTYQLKENCALSNVLTTILVKGDKEKVKWFKDIEVKIGDRLDFMIIISNNSDKPLESAVLKIMIPPEILYKGNLEIDSKTLKGDITQGIDFSGLLPKTARTITFKGEISRERFVGGGSTEISVVLTGQEVLASDSIKINFKKTQIDLASLGQAFSILIKSGMWLPLLISLIVVIFVLKMIQVWFFKKA